MPAAAMPARRPVLFALSLLTAVCLMAAVVLERAAAPAALLAAPAASDAAVLDDASDAAALDRVYRDALQQARSDGGIVGAGFQLANLEPDPFAAKHAAARRAARAAKPAEPAPPARAKPAPPAEPPKPAAAPAKPAVVARPVEPAPVPAITSDADALAAEARAESMVDAAKDLEKAARYEMEVAKAKGGSGSKAAQSRAQLAGDSILSAFSDEVKKLAHLTSESSAKKEETGSWDAVDVSTMSAETKKLDELVGALKGGKTPRDIAAAAGSAAAAGAGGEEPPAAAAGSDGEGKEFEEQTQAKLSDAQSRKDLDKFFDAMSLPEDASAHQRDVGDKYDKLMSPRRIELKQQSAEIKQLEQLVFKLAASQEPAAVAAAGVQRGRAGMRMPSPNAAANVAYSGILRAAQRGEVQALEGQQGGLPGVNVGKWFDGNAEKASEDQMLVGNRFADATAPSSAEFAQVPQVPGMMSADEGGSQLASFSLAPKAKCPPCGFLPSCAVNRAAKGFSRATGTFGSYPAAEETDAQDAYGGGRDDKFTHPTHASTLRQVDSGGLMQSERPLWTELQGLVGGKHKHGRELSPRRGRRLLGEARAVGDLEPDEGGQMLASFTLAPPPKAKAPPKCMCPHCKLGDEHVGFGDEHHGMLAMPMNSKVDMIDEELMKLDPSYAIKRTDPNYNTYEYPFVNNHAGFFAKGVANPLSDFHEDNRNYYNQVATKDKKTIW